MKTKNTENKTNNNISVKSMMNIFPKIYYEKTKVPKEINL